MNLSKQGYLFAVMAIVIFGIQDGISKHLGQLYPPIFVALIRYIAFGAFVLVLSARSAGGIRRAAKSKRPVLQWVRGAWLAIQIVLAIQCFAYVGLMQTQAIFASTPIFVALLSMPVLGEKVGWRRWLAILAGLVGVLVLLFPKEGLSGFGELGWRTLLPLLGAFMLAVYAIMTRLVSRVDDARTSFFYLGVPGLVVLGLIGPFFWVTPSAGDWIWLALLCMTGMASHYLLIRAYSMLDAVAVQPVVYLQLVVGAIIGVSVFGETLGINLIVGACIVVAAGLFTVWREHLVARRAARKAAADSQHLAIGS